MLAVPVAAPMTWDEFDHDNEPQPEWVCPCPECNGVMPGPMDPEEAEEAGAWTEPSAESMVESEWVWAG